MEAEMVVHLCPINNRSSRDVVCEVGHLNFVNLLMFASFVSFVAVQGEIQR